MEPITEEQKRLYSRSACLPRTISVFQIVGAYLVDVYYNHLYAQALKYKANGDVPTITEGYRHATFGFLRGLDYNAKATYKAQHYKNMLIGINETFKVHTSFNTLTVSDCIDKIVQELVPNDYFNTLDKERKNSLLKTVLTNAMREFTKVVIDEFLSAIVDNHDEPANIDALKWRVVDIMIIEREQMYHKFMASHFPGNNETVDKKIAEKMRDEIYRLQAERDNMQELLTQQTEELTKLKETMLKIINKCRKLESDKNRLLEENKMRQDSISELENQINELESNRHMASMGESEFVSEKEETQEKEVSIKEMDNLISAHTVSRNKVNTTPSERVLKPALPTQNTQPAKVTGGKVVNKTNTNTTTATATASAKPVANRKPTNTKTTKPVAEAVKVAKPVIEVAKVESENEDEESEEESEDESERANVVVKHEAPSKTVKTNMGAPSNVDTTTKPNIPKISANTQVVSIASVAEPPKSPKADLGTAPKLTDDY